MEISIDMEISVGTIEKETTSPLVPETDSLIRTQSGVRGREWYTWTRSEDWIYPESQE